ncbi:unnamed protein product [Protopolystoma xenopodis]|uniref:DDE-1 domain-containing protein n=1 Tax=Protopolystoma xenopodis TaxID=117903 RepID=A0A3S5CUK5_9PLAT|nr:unnamed protein product [Protopolystoma xenopodis]
MHVRMCELRELDVLCQFVIAAWNDIDAETIFKSFKKCGISNSLVGMEDDYLWQDEEEAEADSTPSNTEFDPYDDCLANVSQDVIDELMISDDEQEDFEGFQKGNCHASKKYHNLQL